MPVALNQNFKLRLIDLSDDTTIAHAPTSLTVQAKPAPGRVWHIVDFFYYGPDPAGSAAGAHKIEIRNTGVSPTCYNFRLSSNSGTDIYISHVTLTGTAGAPSTAPAASNALQRGLYASNSLPLDITYTNSTDVDQSGTRQCYLVVKEYREL